MKHRKRRTIAEMYRQDANLPTDRDFIQYVLDCAENIVGPGYTDDNLMARRYGLIPPMLQLYKLRHETRIYLDSTKREMKQYAKRKYRKVSR